MKYNTLVCLAGTPSHETFVFTATNRDGSTWYVASGASLVNLTHDTVTDGTDIEDVSDVDCFTWSAPILSESDLAEALNA